MGRDDCNTCSVLEDYYRMKLAEYQLAASRSTLISGENAIEVPANLEQSKKLSIRAAKALLRHRKTCLQFKRAVPDETSASGAA